MSLLSCQKAEYRAQLMNEGNQLKRKSLEFELSVEIEEELPTNSCF